MTEQASGCAPTEWCVEGALALIVPHGLGHGDNPDEELPRKVKLTIEDRPVPQTDTGGQGEDPQVLE